MAVNEKKRQEKLARKKANRKEVLSAKKKKISFGEVWSRTKAIIVARNSPVIACLIRKGIFSDGIGTAVVARKMPNGYLGVGIYLLDVYCLGVKNSYFTVLSENEYAERIKEIEVHEQLENIHPSCIRKLIDQCVDFAGDLGFRPHKDYKISHQLMLDMDPSVCPNQYSFGKDGKPFYISGPHETEPQARKIVDTLLRRCGEGNFDYLVGLGDMGND
jgi:hypothetical protein